MKVTTLEPGDRLTCRDVVIVIESEDDGIVRYHADKPGEAVPSCAMNARELIGWTLLTGSNKGTAPEKRDVFEDLAITIGGSPTTASEGLNAYFAAGWSFLSITYFPQGVYLAILRRRAVGLRPLTPEGTGGLRPLVPEGR